MNNGKGMREYTRISMKVEVDVERISDQEKRTGDTECVSMKGLFIDSDSPFPSGTECVITLWIGGRESQTTVHARGKVVFSDDTGMAAEFISHLGLDSYNHLHNLVLYNAAEDAETVEEEIEDHLHKIQSD